MSMAKILASVICRKSEFSGSWILLPKSELVPVSGESGFCEEEAPLDPFILNVMAKMHWETLFLLGKSDDLHCGP